MLGEVSVMSNDKQSKRNQQQQQGGQPGQQGAQGGRQNEDQECQQGEKHPGERQNQHNQQKDRAPQPASKLAARPIRTANAIRRPQYLNGKGGASASPFLLVRVKSMDGVRTPGVQRRTGSPMEHPADPSDSTRPNARVHIARAQDLLRARDRAGARREADIVLGLPLGDLVARNALGSVLYELDDLDAAQRLFQGVLAENPRYGDALNNLGNILAREGKPRPAREFYERALAEAPANSDYLANLGGVHQALGDVAGALDCFERALVIDPAHADARWNRAIARLLSGDLAGGFADYEARWQLPEFAARSFAAPRWTGENPRGCTILVHSEQGYGDTIQMVRFARFIENRGGRVVLETRTPLAPLMWGVAGVGQVIVHGDALPLYDFHVPIMSLPAACGVKTLGDIPADPYQRAPDGGSIALPSPKGGERRVGLVWAGRPTHKNDRNRSLAPELLAPLAAIPAVRLFSLQVGARTEDLAQIPGIVDLAPQLGDFAATARAIAELDLVICVDTAVAHLAGAMGKPCWLLLPFAPDWRWLLGRDDSPWYPSLRLFRQTRMGDWGEVIARVAAALAAH